LLYCIENKGTSCGLKYIPLCYASFDIITCWTGLFIGEGQFGKVYSAVNMDTGELMAMKEVRSE